MNLNEYFANVKKFKKKIIVISVKDEGAKYIKNFTARSGLKIKMDLKFRQSYVAVIDPMREFLYEKSDSSKIACSYKVGKKYIDIVSAGFDAGKVSSVKVDGEEYSLNRTGINVVILKSKSLKLVESFNCNTFADDKLTVTKWGWEWTKDVYL